jgi:anti-sigma28 factor (negative regulator of flagellin synthesis)
MDIKNEDTRSVSHLDLERTSGARQAGSASSSNSAPLSGTSPNDSITLSITNDLVQQALSSGVDARSSRIEELKHLVETNQYPVDAAAVSNALIEAHLQGY